MQLESQLTWLRRAMCESSNAVSRAPSCLTSKYVHSFERNNCCDDPNRTQDIKLEAVTKRLSVDHFAIARLCAWVKDFELPKIFQFLSPSRLHY